MLTGRWWLVSPAGAGIHPGSESGTCLRTNRSCRLVPAHQGMKIGWIGWWKGQVSFCATHPAPSWGQAPALHFSCDPGLSLFGRRWLVSPAGAGIHPGSESGTCFRTNRSCRLVPAHQGMKMRPGRWKCLGVFGATLPLWIPAFAGMTNSVAGTIRFRTKTGGGLASPHPSGFPRSRD